MPKAAAHGVHTHAGWGLPLRRLPAMDLPFLVLVLTLVGFGLVMLGSASSAVALYRRNDAFAYLRPQLLYAALGIFVIGIGARGLIAFGKYAWENGFGIMDKSPRKSKGSTEEREHYIEKGMTASGRALLLFSGVVHGIFVSGGPLIITYLSNHTKSKEEFRRTVSAIWIILNSMILVSDIMAGYYTMNTIRIQAISVPFLFGGMFLGGILFKRMSQTVFTVLTYILLCIAGISLLCK